MVNVRITFWMRSMKQMSMQLICTTEIQIYTHFAGLGIPPVGVEFMYRSLRTVHKFFFVLSTLNVTMCLIPNDFLSNSIKRNGHWKECDEIVQTSKSSQVFVDIGANRCFSIGSIA
jgi:hypothetical protein